ncbi:MAG TPA: GNAT family N-acetyltransferase [Solirubrobacterales bacterium]|nr:GNAT family N-acetyltransferase [Solirubrobacterales bacterium]
MRNELLGFELELDALTCDETVAHDWGRAFLTPSLPLVWDASWALIERPGLSAAQVGAIADEALTGFAHRTVAFYGEEDGTRAAAEIEALPGWAVERTLYMELGADGAEATGAPRAETVECPLDACADLRRALILGELPDPGAAETAEQLLELDRRYGLAGGDRWFVSPPSDPASACRLFARGEIAQVEDVGTLAAARERGLARAVVEAAIAAARAGGAETIFLTADADDWPQLMYARLGFEPVGEIVVLRRKPS